MASIDFSTSMAASVVSGSSSGGEMERIWSLLMLHILSVFAPVVTVAMPDTLRAGADVERSTRGLEPHAPCDPSGRALRLLG
jgi:hypothetical protein